MALPAVYDPYAEAIDPSIFDAEFREIEERVGPEDPEGYKDAPQPRLKMTLEDAEVERTLHGLRLAQALEYGEWLDHTRKGYFPQDVEKVAKNIIETVPITTIRADHEYNNGVLSSMELYLALGSRDLTETEEALIIEDAALFIRECDIRQHARQYGAILRRAEPDWLQRFGMLVGLDTVNVDNQECGLDMSLIDPLTVFPVWGGRGGLVEVFRVYEDSPRNIIGNYGGPYGKEHDRIERILRRINSLGRGHRLPSDVRHTVIEHWNADWVQVVVDEKEILNRRHGCHEVPFTIVLGGFDLAPGTSTGRSKPAEYKNSIWGEMWLSHESVDTARQSRPFQWRKIEAHSKREAAYGKLMTLLRDADNPTWVYEEEPLTRHMDKGIIDSSAGHTIRVPLGNKLSTLVKTPGAETLAPLIDLMQQNSEQGPWSQINAGGIPPQTSDSALGTMLELGGAAQAVLVQTLELFHQLRFEARLRRLRDFGPVLGPPKSKGTLTVPSRSGYAASPVHLLTREILERTGTYLHAELFHWRANPALAQYINSLRQPGGPAGLPLISDETALRKLKVVRDPDREPQRIEREMIYSMPAIATQRALGHIDEEAAYEIEYGDVANADRLMAAGTELEYQRQQQLMSGQAAPPADMAEMAAMMGMAPGVVPGEGDAGAMAPEDPAINGAPAQQQGLSRPQMGDGVGKQGGRPNSTQGMQSTQELSRATAPKG